MVFSKLIYFFFITSFAFSLLGSSPLLTYKSGRVDAVNLSGKKNFESFFIDTNTSLLSNYLIATGANGRVESDSGINCWRLGAESMGTWHSDTDFWLHSGCLLFCTKIHQTIKFSTRVSNLTFNGRGTIIIEATKNGGFKFIPLEGKGTVSTTNGGSKNIIGGRLLLVLGKPSYFGDAFDIDIMLLLKSSRLINNYPTPLPTFKKIGLAIYVQELKLNGKYDALIGDATTDENLQMWQFGNKKVQDSKKSFFNKIFNNN